eukprot:12966371-Alexandrium_andersonii.AAC.1
MINLLYLLCLRAGRLKRFCPLAVVPDGGRPRHRRRVGAATRSPEPLAKARRVALKPRPRRPRSQHAKQAKWPSAQPTGPRAE